MSAPMPSEPLPPSYPPASNDHTTLLRFVREVPIAYGSWRGLKALYKQVERDPHADPALLGALLGRMDRASLSLSSGADPTMELGRLHNLGGIAVRDSYLYVLGSSRGWGNPDTFAIFERQPTQPLKPRPLASVPVQNMGSMLLCGPYACLIPKGGYAGDVVLRFYDISDPAQPRARGALNIGGFARGACAFPFVYMTVQAQQSKFSGLHIVDLTDADQPRIVGSVSIRGASAVAVEGNFAVVLAEKVRFGWNRLPQPGSLSVVDVADPARPRVVGSLGLGDVKAVTVSGRHAYVSVGHTSATDPAGLHIVDLSDPARPRKLGFCPLGAEATTLVVRSGYVYAAIQYQGLTAVDVTDPAAPKTESGQQSYLYLTQVAVEGTTAFAASEYGGIALLDLTNPARPARIGTPPSTETMGYMKRRARRFLRDLAKKNPERYVMVAAQTLRESGRKQKALGRGTQWVAMDILFGGSKRFRQAHHGRGGYVARWERPFGLRNREERAPDAWDRYSEQATSLLATPDLPWQIHEFAARVLRANRVPLPTPASGALKNWLVSPSPLLVVLATRGVASLMESGKDVRPEIAADSWFRANARLRRVMEGHLPDHARNNTWSSAFATRLAQLVQERVAAGSLTRRALSGAALLARQFPGQIAGAALLPLVPPLLATGRPDLRDVVLAGARQAKPVETPAWLSALEPVLDAWRAPVLDALEEAVRGAAYDTATTQQLANNPSAFVRTAGWRLLAASAAPEAVLSAVWNTLLLSRTETPPLRSAMESPYALGLLERAGIGSDELTTYLMERSFLVGLLTPEAFGGIAATAPGPVVLGLIIAAPDESWVRLRPVLLRHLREGVGLETLWLSTPDALERDVDDRLARRLLGDDEIAETFLGVDDEQVLAIREPGFEPLLGRWVRRHESLFARGTSLLLDAATHPLPEVREWALARLRADGMELPFALQLLESDVPPTVAVGKTFFEALPPGGEREMDYALALCDSPQASVRAYGRDYVAARWDTLPSDQVLRALFENPDPQMQAFVAGRLGAQSARPEETARFDAEVLRAPNRARRAKEQIKTRQSREPTLDTQTLKSIARSRTPRDAEWALAELARRALAGEQIEGVSVDGVTGV